MHPGAAIFRWWPPLFECRWAVIQFTIMLRATHRATRKYLHVAAHRLTQLKGGTSDQTSFSRSGYRRQLLLRCCHVGYAARAARTGRGPSNNSHRRWLRTWLSPWPIWRMPSQRLLRRRLLRRRGSARRGGSARCGGNSARRGSSPAGRFVPSLQRVPMLVCLLI